MVVWVYAVRTFSAQSSAYRPIFMPCSPLAPHHSSPGVDVAPEAVDSIALTLKRRMLQV